MDAHICMKRLLLVIWLLFTISVLVSFIFDSNAYDGETMTLCYLQIMLLTFPLGLIPLVGAGWVFDAFLMDGGISWVPHVAAWLLALFLGYWQWFVIVPMFIKFVRAKISCKNGGG